MGAPSDVEKAAATPGQHAEQVEEVYGPPFDLALTLLDQSMLDIYPASGFAFRLRDGFDEEAVVAAVRTAFQRLVNRIPWLAADMKPAPGRVTRALGRCLADGLSTSKGAHFAPLYDVGRGHAVLAVRRAVPGLRYAEMQPDDVVQGFFPALPLPAHALKGRGAGARHPASGLKATFTEDGHLVLGFSCHHALGDGSTHMRLMRLLAEQFVEVCASKGGPMEPARPPANAMDRSLVWDMTPEGPIYPSGAAAARLASHPALQLIGLGALLGIVWRVVMRVLEIRRSGEWVRRNFRVSTEGLASLKGSLPPGARVSTHDLACALLWRSIMGARLRRGMVAAGSVVSLSMPADVRRQVAPAAAAAASPDAAYLGNAVTMVSGTIPLAELLGEGGVVAGALAIRRGIAAATDVAAIRTQFEMYVASADPVLVTPRALQGPLNGQLMVTSRHSYPPWAWDWGPTLGPLRSYHYPLESGGDVVMVLPANKDGSMAVLLGMDEGCMRLLEADETWRRYASVARLEH